jgi:hypothetical protein
VSSVLGSPVCVSAWLLKLYVDRRVTCFVFVQYLDIVLSTAHKAKGLEFDTVHLTDDYNTDGDTQPGN